MLYQKLIAQEYHRAEQIPITEVVVAPNVRILLFRADLLPAGIKTAIGICLVGRYYDRGQLTEQTPAVIVHGSGNTARAVKLAVDDLNLRAKVVAVVYDVLDTRTKKDLNRRGIEVVETPISQGRPGRVKKVRDLQKIPGGVVIEQHENPDIIEIQRGTFGRAIAERIDSVSHFVAGVGTGGTIFGIGSALRPTNPQLQTVAVEGMGSTLTLWHTYLQTKGLGFKAQRNAIKNALTNYQQAGMKPRIKAYPRRRDPSRWFEVDINTPPWRIVGIEGLGVGDPTKLIMGHLKEIDEIQIVTDSQAEIGVRRLKEIGIVACESAGANFFVAQRIAQELIKHRQSGAILTVVTATKNKQEGRP